MSETQRSRQLYKQEQFPIYQNRMYDTEADAKACPKGDVVLVEDLRTGLIYNQAFQPEIMIYDRHYQNEQAVSPLFQKHMASVSEIVDRAMGRNSLIEVGCGKGAFLELLLEKGFNITGFDPTYEGANPRVKCQFFDGGATQQADGLILRHVLEHIHNPVNFLKSLKEANGGSGKIYIEVPCFEWICERRAWFDIFYEHVNYFRLSDFQRMFGTVIEGRRTFGGQYLSVVADLATLREPKIDMNDRVNFPADFTDNLTVSSGVGQNKTIIWGGASKGVIYALLKARAGQPVDTVIDINPAKQDKFLPATGLIVKSPQKALKELPEGSTIFVMNLNYIEEIKQMSGNKFHCRGVDHA